MEMKLLPLNDSVKVICVVNTVCGPACDSEVRFYNTDWQQLAKEDFIQLPSVGAFYLPVDTLTDEAYAAIREKADMDLVKATLSEDKPIISFTYTTPDYLAKTEREKLVVYIRKEPVVYEWKGGKYNACIFEIKVDMYDQYKKAANLIGFAAFLFWNLCISYKLLFHTVAVAAHELVNTTSCIHQLGFTSVERV